MKENSVTEAVCGGSDFMRTEEEISLYIEELREGIDKVRANKHKFLDEEVWRGLIRENEHRIHTLEWVLGHHERFD